MSNTKSMMIGMKPKGLIKLDIVKLNKSQRYPEENILLGDGLYRYLYQPGEQNQGSRSSGDHGRPAPPNFLTTNVFYY